MADESPDELDRLHSSHVRRARFEAWATMAAVGIVLAAAIILLVGIALPPPPQGLPSAVDWGRAIVDRSKESSPVLLTLLGSLAGMLGITLTRGHMDARITEGK